MPCSSEQWGIVIILVAFSDGLGNPSRVVAERWRGRLVGGARRREEGTMVEEVTRVKATMLTVIMKSATIMVGATMAIMVGGTMAMTGITTEVDMERMREGGRVMGLAGGRVERRRMGRSLKRRLAERRTSVRRGGRGFSKKVSTFVTVAISISFFIHLMVVPNVSTITACTFRTWWQRRLK